MGTNFYLFRIKPRAVHDVFHIGKTSVGWKPTFQNSEKLNADQVGFKDGHVYWDACDITPPYYGSVADIRHLLDTGEYAIIDEYGEFGDENGPYTIERLSEWGRDKPDWKEPCKENPCYIYRDAEGFSFTRQDFC